MNMETDPLPPELAELESRLIGRSTIAPSADFKDRIVTAAERADEARSAFNRWGSLQWSAAAAAILIVLNLSMIAASETAVSPHSPSDPVPMARYLQLLQQVEAQQNRVLK
jgi:hypothetical protein